MVDHKSKDVYKFCIMQAVYQCLKVLDLVPFGQVGSKPRFFALRLENPGWETWQPGQFVMLRPETFGLEQIWARPFSICNMTNRHLICFLKVQGKGTEKIANLASGDKIYVWGPLGNYFALENQKPTLLLAGGMGIAPFIGYVNRHPAPWLLQMFFAHREPLNCYPVDSIQESIPVDTLQESANGNLDDIVYALREKIKNCAEQNGLALACGPTPFLRTVTEFALKFGARCQISLENRMACGVGACLGCVCKTSDKWPVPNKKNWPVQVCTHGPVFYADQIMLPGGNT